MHDDLKKAEVIARNLSIELQSISQEDQKTFFRQRLDEMPESVKGLVEPIVAASLIYGLRAGELPMRGTFDYVMFFVAVVFVLLSLSVAVFIPNPTDYQRAAFRTFSSLGAGAFAGFIPGMLSLRLGNWLKAGGAIAVFVLIYLINPASYIPT